MIAAQRLLAVVLFAAALVWAPRPALGQGLCAVTDTIDGCVAALRQKKTKTTGDTVKAEQEAVKKKTETGLDSIAGLSSSVKDFLPLLQLSGALGEMSKDDRSGAVSVALNLPNLPGLGNDDKRKEFQVKAVIETSPKLFEPLRKQLAPAKDAEALEKQLLKGSEKKDNYAIHVSYTYTGHNFGRDFAQYAGLYGQLFEQVVKSVVVSDRVFARARMKLSDAAGSGILLDETPWSKIDELKRKDLEPLITDVVAKDLASDEAYATAVRQSGISYFGQLVNNQPQLIVTASYSQRDDLFGPNLTTARVSYERGLGNNINAALSSYDPRTCAVPPIECLYNAYKTFATTAAKQNRIKNGDRLSFYAEVVHNAAYNFTRADPALAHAIDKGNSVSVGVDLGRLLGVDDSGTAGGRFDLSVRGEWPADDPKNPANATQNRVVASATITKKMGEISIPFGLIYASNPKFLTGFDHGLTANVGLKFNLFPALTGL